VPSPTSRTPHVLFVCQKNGGKSQMAAALLRDLAGDGVVVTSAGTLPGTVLNAQSVESLAEIGVGVGDEHPKALTPEMLEAADVVVVLGTEAQVQAPDGTPLETWVTDEPSDRGITGAERMRLVRDDIRARVTALLVELSGSYDALLAEPESAISADDLRARLAARHDAR